VCAVTYPLHDLAVFEVALVTSTLCSDLPSSAAMTVVSPVLALAQQAALTFQSLKVPARLFSLCPSASIDYLAGNSEHGPISRKLTI